MAGPLGSRTETEDEKVVNLKGTPQNPSRDPKVKSKSGVGSMGDKALMHSIYIVVGAWLVLLVLYFSLRDHNV